MVSFDNRTPHKDCFFSSFDRHALSVITLVFRFAGVVVLWEMKDSLASSNKAINLKDLSSIANVSYYKQQKLGNQQICSLKKFSSPLHRPPTKCTSFAKFGDLRTERNRKPKSECRDNFVVLLAHIRTGFLCTKIRVAHERVYLDWLN